MDLKRSKLNSVETDRSEVDVRVEHLDELLGEIDALINKTESAADPGYGDGYTSTGSAASPATKPRPKFKSKKKS